MRCLLLLIVTAVFAILVPAPVCPDAVACPPVGPACPLYLAVHIGIFDASVILALSLLLWQFISSWIERKIAESIPEGSTEDVQKDDEWGDAAVFGRSYTLLPMVSLFIGSILAALVTMTILSSMGVDIGPLLAGAGVIGLAIGFGAQKLVADIFPCFFYLLDDAVLKFNPIPRPWSAGWSPPPSWS